MSWYIAEVRRRGSGGEYAEGYVIVDSVTGGIVRPIKDHAQSIFGEESIKRIAAHLERTCGDPRKGEHTIDSETLTVLLEGTDGA